MKAAHALLAESLTDPERASSFSLAQWDLLIRQARRGDLLGTLAMRLDAAGLMDRLPRQPRLHLQSFRRLAERHREMVRWDVRCLLAELEELGIPIILLKGAAYVMADLPPARGRLFSDIDILVPLEKLADTEAQLLGQGWRFSKLDTYDQRYYRQWMHELPPMHHSLRQSSLDVHHNILPQTAVVHPDARLLLNEAQTLSGFSNLQVLSPVDMVLHSATHLFYDGELEHGIRDLVDLDALLRHFGEQDGFYEHLFRRAKELQLTRPLYYAVRYCRRFLDTPVPVSLVEPLEDYGPRPWLRPLTEACFQRALLPDHASCHDKLTGLARWLLYVRSHALRMPPHLLIPHLLRKALSKRFEDKQEA